MSDEATTEDRDDGRCGAWERGPLQLWSAHPNGELDHVNETTVEYFGRSRDQILAWGWAELVHPEDLEECGERWSASLESGDPYRVEFRLRRRDGEYRWHLARAVAERDPEGAIVRWLGANVDIESLPRQLTAGSSLDSRSPADPTPP